MPPKVSVVVPVYNGMAHLPETVASVLAQTYSELEIVLVDGGSQDGSPAWLAGLDDPRIRVIQMPAGTSAAGNWSASCEAATGEFVKLLCQDDLLHPTAIERQVADLQQHPCAAMAIGQRDIVDARGEPLLRKQGATGLSTGVMDGDAAIRTAYLTGTNVLGEPLAVLFRRDALVAQLPWNDSNPLMLDLDMYARVAHGRLIVVRKESVGAFRVSTSSWSTRLAKEQVRQFAHWQEAYAAGASPSPSQAERARAYVGVHLRAAMRRGAYRYLAMRGALHSPDRERVHDAEPH